MKVKKDTLLLNRLNKFLVSLLIFLIPTQLAYHFWPPSAFVFGIRVDYLAPAVYLTDLMIFSLLGIAAILEWTKIRSLAQKYRRQIFATIGFILINIYFSAIPAVSVFRWIKVLEVFGLFVYMHFSSMRIRSEVIYKVLFYSLIFFSLIGISQFLLGKTIGGIFYFLGERSFNISTPGIALFQINGVEYLRAYSVFSHPNSLAGYLGASLLFLLAVNFFKKNLRHFLGFLIIITCLALTFSLSGTFALLVALCFLLINQRFVNKPNVKNTILLVFVLSSLVLPVFGDRILVFTKSLSDPVTERINLSVIAGKIIKQKFLIGEGLGNFTLALPRHEALAPGPWLLQPVHNIFLLAFSELGFFGFALTCLLFYKGIRTKYFPLILFVLITGIFDHYWLTLQQNILLLAVIFGILM